MEWDLRLSVGKGCQPKADYSNPVCGRNGPAGLREKQVTGALPRRRARQTSASAARYWKDWGGVREPETSLRFFGVAYRFGFFTAIAIACSRPSK